jgi:serine O-acetyltransferase
MGTMRITSRDDYLMFNRADWIALGSPSGLRARLSHDIWKFQRLLRSLEYYRNCSHKSLNRLICVVRISRLSRLLAFTIPSNVFGPGLSIAHYGTLVVSAGAKIGANCRVHTGVNIGTAAGQSMAAPCIGDNCYIGPGAKLFGPIELGNNIAIGANAVVNKSFPEGNCTIAGVPAKRVSDKTSEGLLIKGYPLPPH